MQLTTEQLGQHLRKSPLLPVYLIEGDEDLFVMGLRFHHQISFYRMVKR